MMFQTNFNNSACNRQLSGRGEGFYFDLTGSNPQSKINYNSNRFQVAEVSQRYEKVRPLLLATYEDSVEYGVKTGSNPQSKRNYTIEKNNNIYYSNTGNRFEVAEVSQQTDTQLKEDLLFMGCEGFINKYAGSFTYYESNTQFNEEGYCINDGNIYTIERLKEKQYNPTTGKNEYVPCVITGDARFRVMYLFILARRVMKRNVTFGCLLFNACKDVIQYIDNSDNIITPLSIISRVEQVMKMTDEELDNSNINPDSRGIITDPTKENRRAIAQKGRRAVVLSQRGKMYDPTLTDRENALKMGVSESSVRNFRNNADLKPRNLNKRNQREEDIKRHYNPTDSINANFKRMKAMGLDIALSTLKRYVKSHKDVLFATGNAPEGHQCINTTETIQITNPTMKTQYNANMKENTISMETNEERTNLMPTPTPRVYTEEEQRLIDQLNAGFKAYADSLTFEGEEEPTEDEKDDQGANMEVWDWQESETWGKVLNEHLKFEHNEMFRGLLQAVSVDDMNQFEDLFNDFMEELTENADSWDEERLERLMNALLDEMQGLGYGIDNERDRITYRYHYAV